MVVAGADRLGFVAWRKAVTSQSSYCWNIGAQLLPEGRGRGRGTGTQAQRLLVRYLFAHTPVVRIEADPETANIAEQRALEKSGFAPTDRTLPSLPTTGEELWPAAIPGSEESRQGGGRWRPGTPHTKSRVRHTKKGQRSALRRVCALRIPSAGGGRQPCGTDRCCQGLCPPDHADSIVQRAL
ncbi:Acetyltransferase (GNAT) domain-containing protein [Streptomyces sp. 2323.1]|uniref:GNAT family N-acetyltransferase n=1 Tax=Streptomyces sp. 2323.1 TaxID=1938841 RepID=UPI000BB76F4A|nr:GNAT family protein [Streptomyces sp. 2323.1]SOE09106.1 Acetyltransferase (GNAT) domain-containing protein [Streptomyces sp. 2323.1]